MNTRYTNDIQVVSDKTKQLCFFTDQWFNDGGRYKLTVDQNSFNTSLNCTLTKLFEPDAMISPLFVASLVSVWFLVTYYSFEMLKSKHKSNEIDDQHDQLSQEPTNHYDESSRNQSKSLKRADFIDIFRG